MDARSLLLTLTIAIGKVTEQMKKIALVTGSSRGIGAATVLLLAKQGYDICINYKTNSKTADEVLKVAKAYNNNCISIQADVSIEADVVNLFQQIDTQLGPISALVNNAGILLPQCKLIDMNAERINKILTTNVTSSFLCCKEAVKRMSTNNGGAGGAIVNVSSAAARTGAPNEYVDYAASKGALDTLTKGLSMEIAAEGIRVNGVRPGFIYTQMHADGGEANRVERLKSVIPMQRGGEPCEVANSIAWLLSDQASYVTGSIVDVAGGR